MKKRIVITNVPIKLPFNSTILYTFLLWYFKVDNLWWGIFISIFIIYWIICLFGFFNQKGVDMMSPLDIDDSESTFTAKSNFAKRLELLKNKNKS